MHNLSGHSLQFTVIFYNQNISFIEQGAWKKWHFLFIQWGSKALHCVHAVFCAGISMSCIEAPYRPIDKKCNFFLAPDFINYVTPQYNGEYGQ